MRKANLGVWGPTGIGVGAAMGSAGASMGPAVAYGAASGVIVALLISYMRRKGRSRYDG